MARNKKDKSAEKKEGVRKPRKARTIKVTKAKPVKMAEPKPKATSAAGASRAEGIRLFKLAGRPTKEQFQLIYGDRGHLMTWAQREAAGVPAEKFQVALAPKLAGRKSARPSIPALSKD